MPGLEGLASSPPFTMTHTTIFCARQVISPDYGASDKHHLLYLLRFMEQSMFTSFLRQIQRACISFPKPNTKIRLKSLTHGGQPLKRGPNCKTPSPFRHSWSREMSCTCRQSGGTSARLQLMATSMPASIFGGFQAPPSFRRGTWQLLGADCRCAQQYAALTP